MPIQMWNESLYSFGMCVRAREAQLFLDKSRGGFKEKRFGTTVLQVS